MHEAGKAGLTPTYISGNENDEPDCIHCGGVKFFRDRVSGVIPCGYCNSAVGAGIESIGGLSQKLIAASTFGKFVPLDAAERDGAKQAARYAEAPDIILMIRGGRGQARMHLGLAILIAAKAETKGWLGSVMYVAYRNRGISDRRQDTSVLDRILSARLLVFDGLGQERRSDHHKGLLAELAYQRYVQGLATVYTTHLDDFDLMIPDQLRYSESKAIDLDPPQDPAPDGVGFIEEAI